MVFQDNSIKLRVFEIVNDSGERSISNRIFSYFIITIIFCNLFVIFIETYKSISAEYEEIFDLFEYFTIIVFSIEYILRLWTCTCYSQYSQPVIGRLRYAFSLAMIIDLLAFFPFYLALLLPLDPRVVKILRLFRLFRIFKLLRYYGSMDVIWNVLKKNKDYLISVVIILLIFLIFFAYATYILETEAQPDKFEDIDSAFWWAVVTLTTVGYGDLYPVTTIGKFFTVIFLLIGIGVFALPTGIIASGFLEEIRLKRGSDQSTILVSVSDELRKLRELRDDNTINEEEFEKLKRRLI